ncbi:hypothetical protein JAO71_03960 [Olleya sp. YSTF-M6]|uniref:Secreted protein n=1 Tax=Olleya sediminilitoris TaxID=2795739 RepID=A0ABS1WIK6_9FLAO|nr:hypothetical protein [Olleya sediminilitoris]MBL7558951.1 hypothetical protein [Olleya sediminilitoris]
MKFYISLFILLTLSTVSFAQIDSDNNGFAIPAIESDDPEDDPELIIDPAPEAIDVKPDEDSNNEVIAPKEVKTVTKPRPKFSVYEEDNNFRNPAELYAGQLKRQLKFKEDDEKSNNGSLVNQFLGEYKTTAKAVNIIYRDHQYPDGDAIRVYVNDDIMVSSVTLTSGFNGLLMPLDEGINKIDFQALNQGTSGPNTAEFQVLDELGNVIATNQWNLATGVKASIIVVKEKDSGLKLKSQTEDKSEADPNPKNDD